MKTKKTMRYLGLFALLLALVCACVAFAACGSSDDGKTDDVPVDENTDTGNDGGASTGTVSYRFEAELTDMDLDTYVQGSGLSGSAASYLDMIQPNANASEGYAVCYTHRAGVNLVFDITSSEACTAGIHLGLGTDLGKNLNFTPDSFSVKVNGVSHDYGSISLPAHMAGSNDFYDFDCGEIELAAGLNTIVLTVEENDMYNGATAGPLMDYIDLTVDSSVTLTFTSYVNNIAEL